MAKIAQPKDSGAAVLAADTACDMAYRAYGQADEWCHVLGKGWGQLLERHNAFAERLEAGARRLGQGDDAACDMDGLWGEAKAVQDEMDALMACRRAASKRAHAAARAHELAIREWYRAMAEAERAREEAARTPIPWKGDYLGLCGEIRSQRKALKWTQDEAAAIISTSERTYRKFESGAGDISGQQLFCLCGHLGIRLERKISSGSEGGSR